ncbi:MAG: D-glycero-beta-D-manno-heptose 1,7-bisphosphate 7-phosphatase [Chromatiales bacterium]|jgi:D-glycero-D-manno-heptose 1,7-bisphosphate phosphatase|nr:D-glycero-beta-D-manno-heptose 1,7-bisphosphate 7-phosphatase [Chromatiales bacterium]
MHAGSLAKALFLDRDGVINVEKDYVHRIEDFEFVDGIFELCRAAQARGYLLVVITNQSGIGRGYYSEAQFQELTAWMKNEFSREGVEITRVYHCPYHPDSGIGEYRMESFDRKPNPGMILRAERDLGLDLARSILVGDRVSDMQAAEAAGIGCRVLLRTAHSEPGAARCAQRVVEHLSEVLMGDVLPAKGTA